MTYKKMTYVLIAIIAISGVLIGWKLTARNAYESAAYTVVETNGQFEIREYPDLMVATTGMKPESQGNDGSFMRLFRYIRGENEQQEKVAMTTPVFMESVADTDQGTMGFVIPKDVSARGVPEPSGDDVRIETRSGGRFAVLRFRGRMNGKTIEKAKNDLLEWMKERNLIGMGDFELAGYDPPWTPGPLRRNEVLIRLN